MFKKLFQLLNIKKTGISPYHLQCDGQVNIMNYMLIELYVFNFENSSTNWNINLDLVLIEYWSAVKSSTKFTHYFMLFCSKMRVSLDVIYRPPDPFNTRFDYPNEVRKALADAYDQARERLHLAHK